MAATSKGPEVECTIKCPPILKPRRVPPLVPSSEDLGVDNPSAGSSNAQIGSDRSRRQSPLTMELRLLDGGSIVAGGNENGGQSDQNAPPPPPSGMSPFDVLTRSEASLADSDDLMYFEPKLGIFGAPVCRWTSSVMALVGMMFGAVFATSGVCILVFFVAEEPTVWPLGITLGAVGGALLTLGAIMWTSEFLCNDCLGRVHQKLREAPIKSALKRRSRMTTRANSTSSTTHIVANCSRAGSRLSNAISLRTAASGNNRIATHY